MLRLLLSHRQNKYTVEEVENENTTTNKDEVVVEKSFETEALPGDKGKASELGESSNAASKIARFELNPENKENDWDLPESMLDYINKCMNLRVIDKEIKEKFGSFNPVSKRYIILKIL